MVDPDLCCDLRGVHALLDQQEGFDEFFILLDVIK
jgi:hypothetical protein